MVILGDFQTNVRRALSEIDENWEKYDGLIVCGSHNPRDFDVVFDEIRKSEEKQYPFLGICWGYQMAILYEIRKKLPEATSEEWGKGNCVIKKRENPLIGLHQGESYWTYYQPILKPKLSENFICVPYHPEYQSYIGHPHKLLVNFLQRCRQYIEKHRV